MNGIISGIDYSALFGTSSSDAAANILTTLYSGASAATTGTGRASTGNAITDLKLAEANQTKDVALEAKNPAVTRDLAAFTKGITNAKTIGEALKNPNVLKVLLTANGLGDQLQFPALASKALLSEPSDSNSLVNRLSDTRWKTVAKTYDLAVKGLAALRDPTVQAQIAASYEQVTWLNSLDQTTPGLAAAIQFKQQASKITDVDQILGDPTNWKVVLTALDIPQQIAFQDLPAREHAVTSRLNITKLQDPKFVATLTNRYLLAMQQQHQGSSSTPSLDALSIKASGLVI